MDTSVEPFHLDFGPPGTLVKCPRLWRLVLGLLMASVAAVVPWMDGLNAWWTSSVAMDMRFLLGAMALGGAALTLHAIFSDQLHVRRIEIHPKGLSIHWSCSPRLMATRIEAVREVAWHDVVKLEWREGTLEHDLKQHLMIDLKTPLTRKKNRLTLLVCDHRNAERCEALLARLPSGATAPSWLTSTRLRRQVNTV